MYWIRRRIIIAGLMTVLATGLPVVLASQVASASERYATHERSRFNDQYIFATTKNLNDAEGIPTGLKLPLFPVTIVLDTVFLPFAVIAGFVT